MFKSKAIAGLAIGLFAIGSFGCGLSCDNEEAASNPVGGAPAPPAGPTTIFHDTFESGITPWSDQAANAGQGQDGSYYCQGSYGISFWQDGAASSMNTSDHIRRDFVTNATDTTTTFCFMVMNLNTGASNPIVVHLELDGAVMWSMGITGTGGLQINQVAHSPNVGTIVSGTWYSVTVTHTGTTMTRFNLQAQAGPAQADETGHTTTGAGPFPDGPPDMIHLTFGDAFHDSGILVLDDFKVTTP